MSLDLQIADGLLSGSSITESVVQAIDSIPTHSDFNKIKDFESFVSYDKPIQLYADNFIVLEIQDGVKIGFQFYCLDLVGKEIDADNVRPRTCFIYFKPISQLILNSIKIALQDLYDTQNDLRPLIKNLVTDNVIKFEAMECVLL